MIKPVKETDARNHLGEEQSAQFVVGYNMMLLKKASLADLIGASGMDDVAVLEQIQFFREKFDLTGDMESGYELSSDVDKRLAMAEYISSMVNGPR